MQETVADKLYLCHFVVSDNPQLDTKWSRSGSNNSFYVKWHPGAGHKRGLLKLETRFRLLLCLALLSQGLPDTISKRNPSGSKPEDGVPVDDGVAGHSVEIPVRSDRPLDVLLGVGGPEVGEGGQSSRVPSAGEDAVHRATLIERADGSLVDTEDELSGVERAPLREPVLRGF